jgi:hypothetical protein
MLMAQETQPALIVIDLISDDENRKFAPAGRMAAAIATIRKEQGGCLPQDLLKHHFTNAEIIEHWDMANSLADFETETKT